MLITEVKSSRKRRDTSKGETDFKVRSMEVIAPLKV